MNAEAVAADPIDVAVVVVVATSTHTHTASWETREKQQEGKWRVGRRPPASRALPVTNWCASIARQTNSQTDADSVVWFFALLINLRKRREHHFREKYVNKYYSVAAATTIVL